MVARSDLGKKNKSKEHPLFIYKNQSLHYADISISELILNLKLSNHSSPHTTPLYLYSLETIASNINNFQLSFNKYRLGAPFICYALKANSNPSVLNYLNTLGLGADIVSGGELKQALHSGIPAHKIVFSGVGKTRQEIELALSVSDTGIHSFNVESIDEMELIAQCAKEKNKIAHIAFRFNPSVNAPTHKLISTGNKTHKFGLLKSDILTAVSMILKNGELSKHLKVVGISVHIGSQLLTFNASKKAFKALSELAILVSKKLKQNLNFLDIGGGLGIAYEHKQMTASPYDQYSKAVAEGLAPYLNFLKNSPFNSPSETPFQIVCEPGRSIVGSAGLFITKIIRLKKSGPYTFIVVDGGMNDFARPALYQAYHEIYPVIKRSGASKKFNIVGPVCETSDCFAEGRKLTPVKAGDYIVIADTGAYGQSMASYYNLRNLPEEVVAQKSGTSFKFTYYQSQAPQIILKQDLAIS